MSPGELTNKLLDVVVSVDLEAPNEEFVAVSLSPLALAISKLVPAERELTLRAIEEGGALRRAIR